MLATLRLLAASLAVLSFPLTAFAAHGVSGRSHNDMSKRHNGTSTLVKRAHGKATFYDVQTGSEVYCGGLRQNSENIVAMAIGRISGDRSLCGRGIIIHYGGKSQYATVADGCAGCDWDMIDLTIGLFGKLADYGLGVIYVDWEFADGPQAPPPPPPQSTYTPSPTPAPPRPSSTLSSAMSSSPHSASSATSSASQSSVASSASSSGPSGPSVAPTQTSNFAGLYQVIVQYGGLIEAGRN